MEERDEREVTAVRPATPNADADTTYEVPTITYLGLIREVVATTQTF